MRLLVVHTTEGHENSTSPDGACSWWDNPDAKGNAHVVVGGGRIVRYADDDRVAWGAAGANSRGLHLEICGKAAQTGPSVEMSLERLENFQWGDPYSLDALALAARVLAHSCIVHKIEVRRLTDAELLDAANGRGMVTGICGHVDVNRANGKAGHYDPGKAFPWLQLLLAVRQFVESGALIEEL